MKARQIDLRAIYHDKDDRIPEHVLQCMLADDVLRHMIRCLRPIQFEDNDPEAATTKRQSMVAKAQRSDAAVTEDRTRKTEDGLPAQGFRSLLKDLGIICRYAIQICGVPEGLFNEDPWPMELQKGSVRAARFRIESLVRPKTNAHISTSLTTRVSRMEYANWFF